MADGGYLKMRILNYYCMRDESECRSIMCSRQEAACYSIEYTIIEDEKLLAATDNPQTSLTPLEITH